MRDLAEKRIADIDEIVDGGLTVTALTHGFMLVFWGLVLTDATPGAPIDTVRLLRGLCLFAASAALSSYCRGWVWLFCNDARRMSSPSPGVTDAWCQ